MPLQIPSEACFHEICSTLKRRVKLRRTQPTRMFSFSGSKERTEQSYREVGFWTDFRLTDETENQDRNSSGGPHNWLVY
jgi:hypothetical protein